MTIPYERLFIVMSPSMLNHLIKAEHMLILSNYPYRMLISVTTVVEFHMEAGKIQCILHPNEHPERTCLYLVRQFDAELAKLGTFFLNKVLQECTVGCLF